MKLKHLLISLACLLLLAAPAAAAGGDGTSANPYQIETAAELQSIQNDLSAHYILMNDIDLTGVTWTPIGSTSAGFFGELDGNGHTISNLDLSTTTFSTGIFSVLTSGATIKDLTLENCHVENTVQRCGTLIGSIIMSENAHETVILQNIALVRCSATSESNNVANIVGIITSSSAVNIIDCTVSQCIAESVASSGVANIVARCDVSSSLFIKNSEVNSCIAESVASGIVAGIVGSCHDNSSISVEDSNVINSIVKSASNNAAGIFAVVWGSGTSISASGCVVQDCTLVATGNYAGGIAGRVTSGTTGVFDSCTVTDCSILATAYAAGVCPAYS